CLYAKSPLFRSRRAYVERTCDCWFVLSAKYLLGDPDRVGRYYDRCLKGADDQRRWTRRVHQMLKKRFGPLASHTFEFHAGARYRQHLVKALHASGAKIENPTEHLNRAQQLAFYRRSNERNS